VVILEIIICFTFFHHSPFLGFLVDKIMSNNFGIFIVRLLYGFVFVGFVATHSTFHALFIGAYYFVLGLFCFLNYVKQLRMLCEFHQFELWQSTYSQLSLMACQFNELYSKRLFIRTVFPGIVVAVSCFYAMVKFHLELDVISISVLLLIVIVLYPSLEIILAMAASIWVNSVSLISHFKVLVIVRRNNAYKMKTLRVMRPLRIKLGESNFVESSTPLVFISYNLTQISSLLCIKI